MFLFFQILLKLSEIQAIPLFQILQNTNDSLAACSVDLSPVKAAEIGNSVNLDGYGEYISNDELGELVSYGGYISKREYAAQLSDNSVGASYNPRFAGCYDTNGYQITVRRAMAGQYVGESALMIYVNGSRAYCIQPGAALNTGSSLTQTTSSGVWASLSANQKEAVNVALCYGREGSCNFEYTKERVPILLLTFSVSIAISVSSP